MTERAMRAGRGRRQRAIPFQGKIEEVLSRMLDDRSRSTAREEQMQAYTQGEVANVHMDTEKNCEGRSAHT